MRNKNLGIEIKKVRESKKLTQKKLSKKLKVSESTVRMWELGKNKPSIESLVNIASFLEMDIMYLLILAVTDLETELIDGHTERLELQLNHFETLKTQEQLISAVQSMSDLNKTLNSNADVYYKERLLTKEEKEKILTIIDTILK